MEDAADDFCKTCARARTRERWLEQHTDVRCADEEKRRIPVEIQGKISDS
jgi:hypothetical protein